MKESRSGNNKINVDMLKKKKEDDRMVKKMVANECEVE
jgi:hypothetical protein